jgi:aspartate aminotransferase-like enzyme
VLSNGSYGQRIVKICQVLGLDYDVIEGKENVALTKDFIEQRMSAETIRNNHYRSAWQLQAQSHV